MKGYSSVIDHDGRFDEVEENLVWTMKFPSGVLASCSTAYGTNTKGYYGLTVHWVVLNWSPRSATTDCALRCKSKASLMLTRENDPNPQRFQREADHFAECILNDKDPKTAGEEGLRDMKLITQIYATTKS